MARDKAPRMTDNPRDDTRKNSRGIRLLRDRFKRLRRKIGMGMAVLSILDKLCFQLRLPIHIFLVRYYPAGCFSDAVPFSSDRFSLRLATPEELHLAAPNFGQEMSSRFVEAALANGDICGAVFEGDRMIAFQWFSSAPTRLFKDTNINVGPGNYYVYRSYTAPAYRGLRLHMRLLEFCTQYVGEKANIVACIAAYNEISLMGVAFRPMTKLGQSGVNVGMVCLVRCWRWIWTFQKRATAATCASLGINYTYCQGPEL